MSLRGSFGPFLLHVFVLATFKADLASGGGYYWRDYTGTIPEDAVSYEGIYVAQIPYNGLIPASLYAEKKEAISECWGHKVSVTSGIKILCDNNMENFYWDYVNVDSLTGGNLNDLVIGGNEAGLNLYIGKLFYEGEWKIGKVFPPSSKWKGFRGWNRNNDIHSAHDFQVLKYRNLPEYNLVH